MKFNEIELYIGMNEDGSGSPRNMDFILEQAKENHRNGVINDGEYATIIRQVFQLSESKMIREVQRRESGPTFPHHREFRYPPGSCSGPYPEPMPGPMQGGYPPFEITDTLHFDQCNFNIGELLSKLVATGLLPGTEPENTKKTPKEQVKEEKMKGKLARHFY